MMFKQAHLPLISLLGIVLVQSSSVSLSIDGCVDSKGFSSCQSNANDQLTTCLATAKKNGNTQAEILACGCTYYTENINCAAASCWNRVYECNYQTFVVNYLINCPIAKTPLPYFPAPDNAPDSCSCNVGKVYLSIQQLVQQGTRCSNNPNGVDASANVQIIQGCLCCEISGSLSTIYGMCPDTDPTLIGLSSVQQMETAYNTPFQSCGKYLAAYPCVSSLGFSKLDGTDYDSPDSLPKGGSGALSNKDGTVIAPASGSVFTYTNAADNQVYTISAAKAGKGSKASQTSASDASKTGTATGASETSQKKNSATTIGSSVSLAVSLAMMALSCLM